MYQCEFCGSDLPDGARFCGNCGRISDSPPDGQTRISGLQFVRGSERDVPDRISQPGISPLSPLPPLSPSSPLSYAPQWNTNPPQGDAAFLNNNTPTTPLSDEEEEKRRRAAMLGIGLPLLELGQQPIGGNVPMVQGTPQISGVPYVQGTPHIPGGSAGGGLHAAPTQAIPHTPAAPSMPPVSHLPSTTSPGHTLHPQHPHHPQHTPRGCAPTLLITAITIPILIIASIIGLGLTVFAPSLSLSGSSSVTVGGTLSLHGSHFVPGSSVTLTLDDSTPLYVTSQRSGEKIAYTALTALHTLSATAAQVYSLQASTNSISVGGDGTFRVNIPISPTWSIGQHTIHASESLTHRSATLTFTVLQPGGTPTPTGTVTPPITPSVTPTGPSTQPGLSCINPPSVSLGPVSENYSQAVSTMVTLCTNGIGAVNWTASWDQQKASWLALDQTTGQVNAPGMAQIKVSANASQLTAGTYSATITFNSKSNNVTESLNVSFTVQAGCITGTPNSLSFTGVENASNPAPQAVAVTNCGITGTWSAKTQTADGKSWLSVNPTSNTLAAGASTNVTITASNLNAKLAANTYTGTVTFTTGSGSFVVNVTLTVQPAPTLSVTPSNGLIGSQNCGSLNGYYVCYATLTNTSTYASLTWTSSSYLVPTAIFKPSSSTLTPGQSMRVQIEISQNDCATSASITFTGPGNSVTLSWTCYLIG